MKPKVLDSWPDLADPTQAIWILYQDLPVRLLFHFLSLEIHHISQALAGHASGGPARGPGGEGAARGAHGRGATGRGDRTRGAATKRRNARATAFWAHAARRRNSCSAATREATHANPGRPGPPIALARSPVGRLNDPPRRVPAAHAQQRRSPASQAPRPELRGPNHAHRRRGRGAVQAAPGCLAHPKSRAFWLGGGSESRRAQGQTRRAQGEGTAGHKVRTQHAVSTLHGEFLRLLFLQAHRETTPHVTAIGMPAQQHCDSLRLHRRAWHSTMA